MPQSSRAAATWGAPAKLKTAMRRRELSVKFSVGPHGVEAATFSRLPRLHRTKALYPLA